METTNDIRVTLTINGAIYTPERIADKLHELEELQRWENYDYREAVTEDIREYIRDHYDADEIREKLENREDWADELNGEMWNSDSVTGNPSGSYFFNSWKARHALLNNGDLYEEAREEIGEPANAESEECRDVTIRCYLLSECLANVLDELEEEQDENEE